MCGVGFSQFINVSKFASDLAGYTARVHQMLETINDLSRDARFSLVPTTASAVTTTTATTTTTKTTAANSSHIINVNNNNNNNGCTIDDNFDNGGSGGLVSNTTDSIYFSNVTCYTPTGLRLVHSILVVFVTSTFIVVVIFIIIYHN